MQHKNPTYQECIRVLFFESGTVKQERVSDDDLDEYESVESFLAVFDNTEDYEEECKDTKFWLCEGGKVLTSFKI